MHKMKLLSLSIEESYTHINNMLLDGLAALQGEVPPPLPLPRRRYPPLVIHHRR